MGNAINFLQRVLWPRPRIGLPPGIPARIESPIESSTESGRSPRELPGKSPLGEVKIDVSNLSPRSKMSVQCMKNAIENKKYPTRVINVEAGGIHSVIMSKDEQQDYSSINISMSSMESTQESKEESGAEPGAEPWAEPGAEREEEAHWNNLKSKVLGLVNFAILGDLVSRFPKNLGVYIRPIAFKNIDEKDLLDEKKRKKIGKGYFGFVYDVGDNIALKTNSTKINSNEVEAWLNQTRSEVCPRLLAFAYDRTKNQTMCYMELLSGAITLEECLGKMKNWNDDIKDAFITFLAKNLTSALLCIHETKWIHGDLSPTNIMIQPKWDEDIMKLYIIDFDCASSVLDDANYLRNSYSIGINSESEQIEVQNMIQLIIECKYDIFVKVLDAQNYIDKHKTGESGEYKELIEIMKLLLRCKTAKEANVFFDNWTIDGSNTRKLKESRALLFIAQVQEE